MYGLNTNPKEWYAVLEKRRKEEHLKAQQEGIRLAVEQTEPNSGSNLWENVEGNHSRVAAPLPKKEGAVVQEKEDDGLGSSEDTLLVGKDGAVYQEASEAKQSKPAGIKDASLKEAMYNRQLDAKGALVQGLKAIKVRYQEHPAEVEVQAPV